MGGQCTVVGKEEEEVKQAVKKRKKGRVHGIKADVAREGERVHGSNGGWYGKGANEIGSKGGELEG